ncbi:glycosyltransferase family 39 protein [Bacteroidales bacterium OttesenSCG-928-C19]|nr:glycosyltransferase family 39 protein [Bacteroidales bacterium OttesenSCG-928-C19]
MNISLSKRFKNYIIPIGFVVVNLIWKFLSINVLPIDHDEPFTVFYSQMSVSAMYQYLSAGENNPLFFETLLHFWTKIFGVSPFSVRTMSVLFSSATVYFLYQLCRKNFNFSVAVIASIIFTASNYHLGFSHEARTYAMFAFFVTVSMYMFFELIRNPSKKNIWILGIINILLVYSHFFALFIPFVQLVCCILRKDLRKTVLKKFLWSCLITFVGYLPMLFVLVPRFFESASKGTWLGPAYLNDLLYILKLFVNNDSFKKIFALIFVIAGIIHLIKTRNIKIPTNTFIISAWFLIPFCTMFIVSHERFFYTIPMFLDRYMIHTSMPFYILAAIALASIGETIPYKKISICIYALFGILMISSMRWPYDGNKMPEIVQLVNKHKTDKTVIYLAPQYYILNFCSNYDYSYFKNVPDEKPFENLLEKLAENNIYGIYTSHELRKELLAENDRVIYIDLAAKVLYPNNAIIDSLQTTVKSSEKFIINGDRDVWVFDY